MNATPHPPAVIDHESFSITRTIEIAAPVEKVWAAVTEPEHIARWHADAATLTAPEAGGTGEWTFDGYGTYPIRIEVIDRPRSITYRWPYDDQRDLSDANSTVFTFTLEPVPAGTRLTVVEIGFETLSDPAEALKGNQQGWTEQLDKLVAYVEGDA
ncbi:SRPBCC family protein [Demequina sp. NBRC 110053]|uniref:SRPBCC family protein n=1 Tax=Demequina sp. NBRC 110053 TaxID=1570342 RepID=UPI000A0289D1|nr:SRPBCC family protein [Demequina sp. NBRC 110053]